MTFLSRLFLAALVAFLPVSLLAQNPGHCRSVEHYKILALPLHPARISNSGLIVGTTEDDRVATWTESAGLQPLHVPAAFGDVDPVGLNDDGDIVGQVTAGSSGKTQGFAYIQTEFKLLPLAESKAKAINNAGQITGEESPGGPFVWSAGKTRMLGGCCGGRAFSINNSGQVAGELDDREGHYSAFIWDSQRGMQSVAPPGARSSSALAINNLGHILIQSFSPNQIFLRADSKLTSVDLSPELASQPLALNDCDEIVGEYGPASDYYRAFIWDRKNGFRDLDHLVDKSERWNLQSAVDINSRGEIVGTGERANQGDVGFLLIPTPEPDAAKETK